MTEFAKIREEAEALNSKDITKKVDELSRMIRDDILQRFKAAVTCRDLTLTLAIDKLPSGEHFFEVIS